MPKIVNNKIMSQLLFFSFALFFIMGFERKKESIYYYICELINWKVNLKINQFLVVWQEFFEFSFLIVVVLFCFSSSSNIWTNKWTKELKVKVDSKVEIFDFFLKQIAKKICSMLENCTKNCVFFFVWIVKIKQTIFNQIFCK